MQWLRDPDQSNIDNENNVRREASRKFRNKMLECLKAKIFLLKRWKSLNILEQP
jgi:hypothetical protein